MLEGLLLFGADIDTEAGTIINVAGSLQYNYTTTYHTTLPSTQLTVSTIHGIKWFQLPSDSEAGPGQPVYYTFGISNEGNTSEVVSLQIFSYSYSGDYGSAWQMRFVRDDNQNGIHEASESTEITTLTLSEDEDAFFFLEIVPSTDAGYNSQLTVTIEAQISNSDGTAYAGDNGFTYGGDDVLYHTVTTTCPVIISWTDPEDGTEWVPVDKDILVMFATEMDSTTINNSTILLQESSTGYNVPVSISSPDNKLFRISPSEKLHGLTEYKLILKSDIETSSGTKLGQDYCFTFKTLLRKDEGGTLNFGKLIVNVPPNVVFEDAVVESTDTLPSGLRVKSFETVLFKGFVRIVNVNMSTQGDTDQDGYQEHPFGGTICFEISGSKPRGNLKVYYYSGTTWEWKEAYFEDGKIKVELPLAAPFVVVDSVMDEVKLYNPYPNPFNPAQGLLKIEFEVTDASQAKVYIYSIDGAVVKVIKQLDPVAGVVLWDGKDSSGKELPAGLYYMVLKQKGRKDIKRVVIKR